MHRLQSDMSVPPIALDARVSSAQGREATNDEQEVEAPQFKTGFRFWAVMAGLGVASLMASLENSVVVTAGPAIVADLNMGDEYVWISNAFFICWYVRSFDSYAPPLHACVSHCLLLQCCGSTPFWTAL